MTFSDKEITMLIKYPHRLGHLCGKDKLSLMHTDWIKYIWNSVEDRALQAHRGSYKTTAITEIGCMWWLLFHPSDRIAIVRKPYTEAAKTLRTVKNYFLLPEIRFLFKAVHGIFPEFDQKKENSITFNFKRSITKEGNIDAYGVDGNLTGNHYDKMILDDAITLKDRLSRAERQKTDQCILEILTNIIDPGKHIGSVGTPWHKEDSHRLLPTPLKFDVFDTRILTSAEIENKRAKTTRSLFACNYLLKHEQSEDAIFTEPKFRAWDFAVKPVYMHIDAKFKGDHYGAITVMARTKDCIQAKGWLFTKHVVDCVDWIAELYKSYRCKCIHIENNADQGYTEDILRKAGCRVMGYHEKMNKHMKIASYLKNYWLELEWDASEEYLSHVCDYREGQLPDDAPDSAASLLREAFYRPKDSKILYQW